MEAKPSRVRQEKMEYLFLMDSWIVCVIFVDIILTYNVFCTY